MKHVSFEHVCDCFVAACIVVGRMLKALVHVCSLSTTLYCFATCFTVLITLYILTFCYNIYLILHLSYCLALCSNSPADCSHKSHPDSGSDPSRVLVKISGENCAYFRFSNLIPFSPSGLRDPRVHYQKKSPRNEISQ